MVYTDINTAYTDTQGGNLDVLNNIPPDAIASAPDEFGDRYGETPSSSFTYMGFPTYDPRYADKRVRQAFSMAIDREAITEAIFNGTRTPAYSVIAPVVDGYRDDACQYCKVDVEKANQLLDEAGFDRSKPVDLWFNAGAGHDAWVEAVGNQLRENLGVEFTLQGNLDFAEYLPLGDAKGYHRAVPSRLEHGLPEPAELPGAAVLHAALAAGRLELRRSTPTRSSTRSSPRATQAATNDEAIDFYQQAEDILLEDMPIMPMFFGLEQTVWSENVDNVDGRHLRSRRRRLGDRQLRLHLHDRRRGVPAATTSRCAPALVHARSTAAARHHHGARAARRRRMMRPVAPA